MIQNQLTELPREIVIKDYREYMPYKVCTGGSYLTFVTLEKQAENKRYKKIYGTESPNSFNKATGKFRDKTVDDTLEESYEYLTYTEMQAFVMEYANKKSQDIKIYIDAKEVCYV